MDEKTMRRIAQEEAGQMFANFAKCLVERAKNKKQVSAKDIDVAAGGAIDCIVPKGVLPLR